MKEETAAQTLSEHARNDAKPAGVKSVRRGAGRCLAASAGWHIALAAAALGAGSAYASSNPGETGVVVETLSESTAAWDGSRYRRYPGGQPQLSVLRYRIPPNTALPWHLHPVPNAAYVVSGVLTVERRSDGKTLTIGPGNVLPEMVDAVHRGVSGNQPVELIVFYAGAKHVPLTRLAEGPTGSKHD